MGGFICSDFYDVFIRCLYTSVSEQTILVWTERSFDQSFII